MSNVNSFELINQRGSLTTTAENEKQGGEILGIPDNEFGLIIIGTVFGIIGLGVFGYIGEQVKKKFSGDNTCGERFKRWWDSLPTRKQHNVEGENSDNVYDQPYALDDSGPPPYALHEATTSDSNPNDDESIYEVYNYQNTSSC